MRPDIVVRDHTQILAVTKQFVTPVTNKKSIHKVITRLTVNETSKHAVCKGVACTTIHVHDVSLVHVDFSTSTRN